MSGSMLAAALQIVLSGLLGGVFVAAALPKLRHPRGFLLTVMTYQILPDRLSRVYARLVPSLELLAALLLFAGVAVRAVALLLVLLALSFAIAIGTNLARGRDLDCGCFGTGLGRGKARRIGPGVLLQDIGLLGAALLLFATTREWTELASWSPARLFGASSAGALLFVACVVVTASATVVLGRGGPASGRPRSASLPQPLARSGRRANPVENVERAGAIGAAKR